MTQLSSEGQAAFDKGQLPQSLGTSGLLAMTFLTPGAGDKGLTTRRILTPHGQEPPGPALRKHGAGLLEPRARENHTSQPHSKWPVLDTASASSGEQEIISTCLPAMETGASTIDPVSISTCLTMGTRVLKTALTVVVSHIYLGTVTDVRASHLPLQPGLAIASTGRATRLLFCSC